MLSKYHAREIAEGIGNECAYVYHGENEFCVFSYGDKLDGGKSRNYVGAKKKSLCSIAAVVFVGYKDRKGKGVHYRQNHDNDGRREKNGLHIEKTCGKRANKGKGVGGKCGKQMLISSDTAKHLVNSDNAQKGANNGQEYCVHQKNGWNEQKQNKKYSRNYSGLHFAVLSPFSVFLSPP